jgi:hypothetical protein
VPPTTLRFASAIAAFVLALPAFAGKLTLNFTGTITSHYDGGAGHNVSDHVGEQVTGYLLLDLAPHAASFSSDTPSYHARGWYSGSGCMEYRDNSCRLSAQDDPASPGFVTTVLGYGINLPTGLATPGSLMSVEGAGSMAGISRTQTDPNYQFGHLFYFDTYRSTFSDYSPTLQESQELYLGAWANDHSLFSNIDQNPDALDLLSSSNAFISFAHIKTKCGPGYCVDDPSMFIYEMKLTDWSTVAAEATVPEPPVLAMFALGLAGLIQVRRRAVQA